jgi:uncharacterized protein (TIGR03067 family)
MNRLLSAGVLAAAFLSLSGAQDRPILPPGPAPGPAAGSAMLVDALFVQANTVEGGEVMFLVPVEDDPDPNKLPPPPARLVRVDGKAVRAFGTDRKPLDVAELTKRLSVRTAVVVVHGQPPDPFFLKALNERSVVFVVTRKLFDRMAKFAGGELLPGFWNVMQLGKNGPTPTGDHWVIDGKIAVHRGGKLDSYMAYKADATDYPKTIDLVPDRGPAKGKVLRGIYELDGNTLKICHVSPITPDPEKAERPREMGAKDTVTWTFGRVLP